MNPFQSAFQRLKQVDSQYQAIRVLLEDRIDAGIAESAERDAERDLERTYAMRLLAEFEGALTDLAPSLSVPITFDTRSGLHSKIHRIAAGMMMDPRLITQVDQKLRLLRNDLLHGRVAPFEFNELYILGKQFLRNCH